MSKCIIQDEPDVLLKHVKKVLRYYLKDSQDEYDKQYVKNLDKHVFLHGVKDYESELFGLMMYNLSIAFYVVEIQDASYKVLNNVRKITELLGQLERKLSTKNTAWYAMKDLEGAQFIHKPGYAIIIFTHS